MRTNVVKIVPEFLHEAIDFQRGIDPKTTIGIGVVEKWKREILEMNDQLGGNLLQEYIIDIMNKGPEYKSKILDLLKIFMR